MQMILAARLYCTVYKQSLQESLIMYISDADHMLQKRITAPYVQKCNAASVRITSDLKTKPQDLQIDKNANDEKTKDHH